MQGTAILIMCTDTDGILFMLARDCSCGYVGCLSQVGHLVGQSGMLCTLSWFWAWSAVIPVIHESVFVSQCLGLQLGLLPQPEDVSAVPLASSSVVSAP